MPSGRRSAESDRSAESVFEADRRRRPRRLADVILRFEQQLAALLFDAVVAEACAPAVRIRNALGGPLRAIVDAEAPDTRDRPPFLLTGSPRFDAARNRQLDLGSSLVNHFRVL